MSKKTGFSNLVSNSIWGIVATLVSTIITFAVRTVLSRSMGEEVYGLNSLFSSITSVLLIMEVGISTAMVIYLYKPIANDDHERVKTIIRFYRNAYLVFCSILLITGLIVDIFLLDFLVKSNLDTLFVKIGFLIFLTSIIVKYLWSYKRAILYANQQNRISTAITAINDLVFGCIEILLLIFVRNYIIFLAMLVLQQLVCNAICNSVINKKYPYIKEKSIIPISKDDKGEIFNTLKPMMVQRISGTVQDSANTIILGALGSTVSIVGFYANYQLIIHTAQSLFSQFGGAFTTTFGGISIDKNNELMFNTYKKTRFAFNFISIVIVACFLCLVQDFISIVFGDNYVLEFSSVVLLTFHLYIYLNNIILMSVQNATGSHGLDASAMVIQAAANIGLSILLGVFFGLNGIIIGTLISVFLFSTVYKGIIIYKKLFLQNIKKYVISCFIELIRAAIVVIVTFFAVKFIFTSVNIWTWLIKAIISLIVSLIISTTLSFKNKYFREIVMKIGNFKKKPKKI
ncbi:oligosaccharide flippase family protein [Acholeplasma sp. OttesenSCG-928-E16]|nr:oligosaccharide flippase family protein [Acholeplasma sp. OttesenSCG-928-E16]